MNQLFIDGFDAEAYWKDKEYKKWVVYLTKGSGKKAQTDRVIVSARTEERAIACGKANSMFKGRVGAWARLAHPADLGCKKVDPLRRTTPAESSLIYRVLESAGKIVCRHNLLSTATDKERRETIGRFIDWWNKEALPALSRAEGSQIG